MGEFTGADFARRVVSGAAGGPGPTSRRLAYDELVLALGSVTNLPPVPGLAEHALQVKGVADAIALRDRAIRLLEQADRADDPTRRRSLLHFVVVGSSFTGVEVAGEFEVFLQARQPPLRQRRRQRHLRHPGRHRRPHPAQPGRRAGRLSRPTSCAPAARPAGWARRCARSRRPRGPRTTDPAWRRRR